MSNVSGSSTFTSAATIADDRGATAETKDFVVDNFHNKAEDIDLRNQFKVKNAIDAKNDQEYITMGQLRQILTPIHAYLEWLSDTYEIILPSGLKLAFKKYRF